MTTETTLEKFTWPIGKVDSEADAKRLRWIMADAKMRIFKHQIKFSPPCPVDGSQRVEVEVEYEPNADARHLQEDIAQILAYFFRLYNETHDGAVDLHLKDYLLEAD